MHRGIDVVLRYREHMAAAHAKYMTALMEEADGSVMKAAVIAGVNRTDLYRHLRKVPETFHVKRRPANRGNAAWQALGR